VAIEESKEGVAIEEIAVSDFNFRNA
jgi:hypothetical protein